MPGRRRRAVFELTDQAHTGLDAIATRHHTTKTTIIEALGTLARHADPTLDEVIAEARRLDVERRSRRP